MGRGGGSGSGQGLAYTLLVGAMVIWGLSFRVTAIGSEHSSGLILAALRVGPATILMLLLLPILHARLPRGEALKWAAVTGVLMVTVFYCGFTEGIRLAGAANASVLANSSPFFVVLVEVVFLGARLARTALLGILIGFAGIVLMVANELGSSSGGSRLVAGLALALAAGAGWGVGTVMVKQFVNRKPETDLVGFTAGQLVVGGSLAVVIGFASESASSVDWGSWDLWWPVLYLAAGATVVATLFYFFALRRLPAVQTSAALFIAPVVAIVVEVVRGHAPGSLTLVGMALAIVGVTVVNVPMPRVEAMLGGKPAEATS